MNIIYVFVFVLFCVFEGAYFLSLFFVFCGVFYMKCKKVPVICLEQISDYEDKVFYAVGFLFLPCPFYQLALVLKIWTYFFFFCSRKWWAYVHHMRNFMGSVWCSHICGVVWASKNGRFQASVGQTSHLSVWYVTLWMRLLWKYIRKSKWEYRYWNMYIFCCDFQNIVNLELKFWGYNEKKNMGFHGHQKVLFSVEPWGWECDWQ